MLFAFGMPSATSIIIILAIVFILFSLKRWRTRTQGVKGKNFNKWTLH
jgi:Sec-independent protein translocase protein TatA